MENTRPTSHFTYSSHPDGRHTVVRSTRAPAQIALLSSLTRGLLRYTLPAQLLFLIAAVVFGAHGAVFAPAVTVMLILIGATAALSIGCRRAAGQTQVLTVASTAVDLTRCFNTLRVAQAVMRETATEYDEAAWRHLAAAAAQLEQARASWPGRGHVAVEAEAADHDLLCETAERMAFEPLMADADCARGQVLALEVLADDDEEARRIRAEMARGSFDSTFA